MAPIVILGAMFLVLLMLGMFMDQVSMMLITVPVFYPLISVIGTDIVGLPTDQVLVWFSLVVLIALEMSATTPPFGLLLFIMLGMVRGTSLGEVALAAAPYLVCDLILVLLLIAFPLLAMYLPNLMGV